MGALAARLAVALAGDSGGAATRRAVRRRVRAIVAGGSVLWLASNLVTLGGALAHADLSHDAAGGVKAAVELLLNLPGVAEVPKDLAHIGLAVSLGLAQKRQQLQEQQQEQAQEQQKLAQDAASSLHAVFGDIALGADVADQGADQ